MRSTSLLVGGCVVLLLALLLVVAGVLVLQPPQTRVTQADPDAPAVDVIYVPTPHPVVDRMLEAADIQPDDLIYDLGCGDGRIVVAAARRYGVRAIGVDISPRRVAEARENVRRNGVEHLVTIKQADMFQLDFRDADVVFMYLFAELNVRLMPQLAQLKPGSRIVSHSSDMRGARPTEILRVTDRGALLGDGESAFPDTEHKIYKWVVPWESTQGSTRRR